MNMDVYIWIFLLCLSVTSATSSTCSNEARCKISRIRAMKAADCYNKDMKTFSQCLPQDVEIVDLSHNRIRKLGKEDLKKYSDLKMLYLNDNAIAVIDKETFEGKDYLHTLDISLNSISKLPAVLFHLPSLQSMYLGQNLNMNIADVVEKTKPISSPLFHLDISYIMSEEPSELPDFGLMTNLEKYNISGNKLISLSTKHFAGLCNLKILDTTNVSIEYDEDRCACWTVNRWLKNRKVIFKPFVCSVSETECTDDVPPDDLSLYEECVKEVQEKAKQAKVKTILLIVVPISVVVIIAILAYYFIVKKRQKEKKKQKMDQSQEIMLNNATVVKA